MQNIVITEFCNPSETEGYWEIETSNIVQHLKCHDKEHTDTDLEELITILNPTWWMRVMLWPINVNKISLWIYWINVCFKAVVCQSFRVRFNYDSSI